MSGSRGSAVSALAFQIQVTSSITGEKSVFPTPSLSLSACVIRPTMSLTRSTVYYVHGMTCIHVHVNGIMQEMALGILDNYEL